MMLGRISDVEVLPIEQVEERLFEDHIIIVPRYFKPVEHVRRREILRGRGNHGDQHVRPGDGGKVREGVVLEAGPGR